MALRKRLCHSILEGLNGGGTMFTRFYTSNFRLKKLRPMILKRIENRSQDYPVKAMIPVAQSVLKARDELIQGVSILLKAVPVLACKYCPEVYIGEEGHLIQTCCGYRRRSKNQVHKWITGTLNDVLVPVETFHLHDMFQDVIKHNQRFDYERIPAVVELCLQAGADPNRGKSSTIEKSGDSLESGYEIQSLSYSDMALIAQDTLKAWERLTSGVKRLLFVYSAKVCKHCSEVHVGPSGHKARLCGVFNHESWHGTHFWKKATVQDLVPPKNVWFRRPQDPPILLDEFRNYYGHAPAAVALCSKAGAIVPKEYHYLMKFEGLSAPPASRDTILH